jgi:hypothetical protein
MIKIPLKYSFWKLLKRKWPDSEEEVEYIGSLASLPEGKAVKEGNPKM